MQQTVKLPFSHLVGDLKHVLDDRSKTVNGTHLSVEPFGLPSSYTNVFVQ